MDRKEHWEDVYATKGVAEVSWFEAEPQISLDLIEMVMPSHGSVIDIGGGASQLVDRLLDRGFGKVTVLDISAGALDRSKSRLGPRASQVKWIVEDVTAVESLGHFDVWHDRAVFHFLITPKDRQKYIELATRTVPSGGHLIIGTFAIDGPPKCSGLEVCQYDSRLMTNELGHEFKLIKEVAHTHITPWGTPQSFFFGLFRRV